MSTDLKTGFSRFLDSDPNRLHFAAHSHHPWPDVSFDAQQQVWEDAAAMMDDKWDHIFGRVLPETKALVSFFLGTESGATLAFAPNTHNFLVRLFSSMEPPVRILSTGSEFHSFSRQSRRWEEEGLAIVDRVPTQPFETFADRFEREAASGVHDLIYLSEVFYDTGFVTPRVEEMVSSASEQNTLIVIDGYHGFMARPSSLPAYEDRGFYLAGGYKYAMSGEGVCFLHAPSGLVPRPVDTGWYAGFAQLETGVHSQVPYPSDGSRFSGSTFDPSGVYRMRAVLGWLRDEGVTPASISDHVQQLQAQFLGAGVLPGELIPGPGVLRGNFLAFETRDAERIYRILHAKGVITDHRNSRLRIGFGIYQDAIDVENLTSILEKALAEVGRR